MKALSPRILHQGFSLIEVLVALLVLSIGLLGLAMLQVTGLKFNSDSYSRTQATMLAYDIIDRMRANSAQAGSGGYTVPDNTAANNVINQSCSNCNCDTAACTAANLALYDLKKWYAAQQSTLPQSPTQKSTIAQSGNTYTITMQWMERDIPMSQSWVVNL